MQIFFKHGNKIFFLIGVRIVFIKLNECQLVIILWPLVLTFISLFLVFQKNSWIFLTTVLHNPLK
jgi:hypothetical protein